MKTDYLDNYYSRLGILPTATLEDIETAYHQAAWQFNPENNSDPNSIELFLRVKEAYEFLIDQAKRTDYNKLLPNDFNPFEEILINTTFSRTELAVSSAPQLLYVYIDMMARKKTIDENSRDKPPLNICLLVDTSTSMAGDRFNAVKNVSTEIIRSLGRDDILSIVSFNDFASVLVPASRVLDSRYAEEKIIRLRTGGSTEIYKGMQAAKSEIMRFYSPGLINHMILITDGHTYGDEEYCYKLAEDSSRQQIGISAIGIGEKWKDEFLDKLTSIAGGGCEYAENPNSIKNILNEKIQHLNSIYANNIQLEVKTPENVDLRYAFRFKPNTAVIEPTGNKYSLGDITTTQSLSLLLELYVKETPQDVDMMTLLDGNLSISVPKSTETNRTMQFSLTKKLSANPEKAPPPPIFITAMSKLKFYRMQNQAMKELDVGNTIKATQILRSLEDELMSRGEPALAKTIHSEITRIQKGDTLSAQGKKQIKYGTRSLVAPSKDTEMKL
jgi:Ca-activated chloride channel family protein